MSDEIAVHKSTELSIVPEQTTFTPAQVTALSHIGVENATPGDLEVFFHVAKRTGLDPFARQIYMIGRNAKVWDPRKREERWITKFTIQTGIDGYRLIGRRAANQAKATISVKAPQWAHREGGWRDVWMPVWGTPVAARVTIVRSGEEFTATALFEEYVQTTKNGDVTPMWKQRPAGQIAKCAEALAWRMAFPQDLSGIYVDEEMHHADMRPIEADVVRREPGQAAPQDRVRAAIAKTSDPADSSGVTAPKDAPREAPTAGSEEPAEDRATQSQLRKLHATFSELGITARPDRLAYASKVIDRDLKSSNEMSKVEASTVIEALNADLQARTDDDVVEGEILDPEVEQLLHDVYEVGASAGFSAQALEQRFADVKGGRQLRDGSVEDLESFAGWLAKQPKGAAS